MMHNRLSPRSSVTKFSIKMYNDTVDMLSWWRKQQRSTGSSLVRANKQSGIILVQNDSGQDLDRFDLLGLDSPLISPDDNLPEFSKQVTFTGIMPDIHDHRGKFCVLQQPLASGKVGRAIVAGVTPVRIYVNEAVHEYADILTNQATRLDSGGGGAQILWKPSGTGELLCTVRLGAPERIQLYELTTTMDYDSSVKEFKADGKPVHWNSDTELYTLHASDTAETLWLPTAFRDQSSGSKIGDGPISYTTGQRVYTIARLHAREIISPPLDVWRFELKDNMPTSGSVVAGQSATAYLLKSDGSIDTDIEFEVVDELGIHRGRANGKYSDPHDRGSQGYAKYMPDTDQWEIIQMQPHALQIMGLLTGDLAKATGSFDVESVYIMQPPGAIITDTDPASSTFSITNRAFDGDDGFEMIATWDEKDTDWKALDVICPA